MRAIGAPPVAEGWRAIGLRVHHLRAELADIRVLMFRRSRCIVLAKATMDTERPINSIREIGSVTSFYVHIF